jgi:hypothetical protein
MPYYVEKGPYFTLLDSLSEQPLGTLLSLRNDLDSGSQLSTIAGALAPAEFKGDFGQHLADDWFGESDPADKPTTGWWLAYKGNVEEVMRETFIRAIDVSLGIDRSTSPATYEDVTRHWPVQFLWICGSRWFEGWVNWHAWGTGEAPTADDALTAGGMVTVMFVTPGMKDKEMYRQPERPDRHNVPDYAENPNSAQGDHGLWCVSDRSHDRELTGVGIGFKWGEDGDDKAKPSTFETSMFVDGGPVVVVSPAEIDGGVLHAGRQY